jgi:DNA repair exonuclease SbcCD ATPase subunit
MFIKKIELTNFKNHSSSHFNFGKTNHFFGDNYAGKSSIGEAIVFCLYGMTKHGYKGFVKDYLQVGKTSMKVQVTLAVNNHEYIIERKMNPKGTTSVFINNEAADDKNIKKLLGDYQTFIYCFFPDIFPEEDKNTARSYLINNLLNDKSSFDDIEKEKKRIVKQQKSASSTMTFFEGQKSILKKQIESNPSIQSVSFPKNNFNEKKDQLLKELATLKSKLEQHGIDEYQLHAKISSCKDSLKEIEVNEQLTGEYCPICHQVLPDTQIHSIRLINYEKKSSLNKELEVLEMKLKLGKGEYNNLYNRKTILEKELFEMDNAYPSDTHNSIPIEQLNDVENKLKEIIEKKNTLSLELKQIKNQMGQLANNYQNQINQYLNDTRIDLFKQLKNGELRPDFLITYKNRPYRVLSYSEKIRCMLEIISLINNVMKVKYPIFLDNLESITHLSPPETQIITATVKKGMPLTLKMKE